MSKINLSLTFIFIIFKLSIANSPSLINHWIIWNIGQGQWITHVLNDHCLHYDAGGEFNSFKKIKNKILNQCKNKQNRLSLSHWDFDHYMNIQSLYKNFKSVCWDDKPTLSKHNKSIQTVLDLNISNCAQLDIKIQIERYKPTDGRSSNDSSSVVFDSGVLITGDSTTAQEKIWVSKIKSIEKTKVLILGHHGSRTSTSDYLLKHLPNLQTAVASARFKKYRHPHKETLQRLIKNKTPVLKTEDWGSILIL